MHYTAAILAFAFVGSSSAWWHNNSTAVPVGSASGVSPPNPPTTSSRGGHPSGVPSGHGPHSSHGLSTGVSPSMPGNSGSIQPSNPTGASTSGHGPYPSHGLSTGVSPSVPGASGSKYPSKPPGASASGHPSKPTGDSGSSHPSKPTGASGSGNGGSPPVSSRPPPKTTSITVPGIPSKTTKTHFITTTMTETITKFVPCSTAIATDNGHTYYSSSLTTSLTSSTTVSVITEYTVYCPAPTKDSGMPGGKGPASAPSSFPTDAPGSGSSNGDGSQGENCPPAETVYRTVEIYKTVTVGGDAGSSQTQIPGSPGSSGSPTLPFPSGDGNGAAKPTGTGAHGRGKETSKPTATHI
ncbi:MAG: hypothetical protein Q9217_002848 [Psora testacea]